MAHKNIAAATGLLVFTGLYGALTATLPERSIMPNTPGPSFFPWLITAGLCALSLALLYQGITRLQRHGGTVPVPDRQNAKTPGLALASMAVYLAALPFLGFIPASIVFFAVLMWLYGARKPVMIAAGAVIAPVILFVLFRYGFNIILPRGPW